MAFKDLFKFRKGQTTFVFVGGKGDHLRIRRWKRRSWKNLCVFSYCTMACQARQKDFDRIH